MLNASANPLTIQHVWLVERLHEAGYDLAMLLGSLAVGLIVQIDFPRFRTEH